jgi:hypothetical protein
VALTLHDFFVFGVLVGPLHLHLLVLLLSSHSIFVFFVTELLQCLGREVVARTEHLVLVLLSDIYQLVGCVLLNFDTINLVFSVLGYDAAALVKLVGGSHEVWSILHTLFLYSQIGKGCKKF